MGTSTRTGNGRRTGSAGKSSRVTENSSKKVDTGSVSVAQAMLDSSPINTIFADLDLVIRYMNPASEQTMRRLERYLPCRADEIVGSSIDIFHKNPDHQRKLLADPHNLPHRAIINLGPEKLDLLVSPIYDADGDYRGPMVTWDIVTEKLALESEAARLKSAIEGSSTAVMMVDLDLNITYVNPATEKLVAANLPTFKRAFPGFDPNLLIGTCIDIFHKNPEHQRRILADQNNLPYQATINLGELYFELNISAMLDAEGGYIGATLEWKEVTEARNQAEKAARLNSMVENAPNNIMFADREGNIQYVNPASLKTFRNLEKYLPCRADDVVGSSFDIFHKNPSHQRNIISDPKNLPYRAKIKLGPETLDLLVSAIYDSEGEYIGPMATWEVISRVEKMLGVVTSAAEGDLSQDVSVSGKDPMGQVGEALQRFMSDLRESMSFVKTDVNSLATSSEQLQGISQTMASAAEETSAQAEIVNTNSNDVSQNVQMVAAGIEELGASIREIAANAARAAKIATEGVDTTKQTNVTVVELGDSSTEIGNIVKVITSIAQQTNLLALNATIEAARAGDAGKGFAVVANEVKELAKETSAATEDISRKIEGIQNITQDTVKAIGSISDIIEQINEIQTQIAAAVEQQAATAEEIGNNISQAARGSQEIADNVAGVAEAARSTSSGASDTQTSADGLGEMAQRLRKLLDGFKLEQS